MLCCETGGVEAQDFEDLTVFVTQLNALGVRAMVHARSVPEGLNRNLQFDLAPHLFDGALGRDDRVALVAAQRVADQKLAQLRRLAGGGAKCLAVGSFESRQTMIAVRSKLSYVFGRDPNVLEIAAERGRESESNGGCPVFGVARRSPRSKHPRVLLVAPKLTDRAQSAALVALSLSRTFDIAVLTDGKSKQEWVGGFGAEIAFYHYGEIPPAALAERVDICVCFTPPRHNFRMRCLVANLAVSGAALVDATSDHGVSRAGDSFVPGPIDLSGLARFLGSDIFPNLGQIADHVLASRSAGALSPNRLVQFLGAAPRPRPLSHRVTDPARVVFVPTNGVGLGHAQRCALVAAELDKTRTAVAFAAFPSCCGLLRAYGFNTTPLIARSALHAQAHENDLVNYLRLGPLTADAQTFVFDGGYIFDSVYRSVVENQLRGVWIRRGLWQISQQNSVALDREKVFKRVIVPSEAFEELNASYSRGAQVHVVGPIVQRIALARADRGVVRERLAARFARPFERLVVTMLGAGVAANRDAQIQALCGMLERRRNVLHLVVVWPTSVVQPVWFGWQNSRVVRTHHAGVLAAAADLCVCAAGYNSFHEVLYNAIPTIFVAQAGSFMDDQRARAAAAKERGLAGLVNASELIRLEREISRFLDQGAAEEIRGKLAALDLPAPGTREAAQIIAELAHE